MILDRNEISVNEWFSRLISKLGLDVRFLSSKKASIKTPYGLVVLSAVGIRHVFQISEYSEIGSVRWLVQNIKKQVDHEEPLLFFDRSGEYYDATKLYRGLLQPLKRADLKLQLTIKSKRDDLYMIRITGKYPLIGWQAAVGRIEATPCLEGMVFTEKVDDNPTDDVNMHHMKLIRTKEEMNNLIDELIIIGKQVKEAYSMTQNLLNKQGSNYITMGKFIQDMKAGEVIWIAGVWLSDEKELRFEYTKASSANFHQVNYVKEISNEADDTVLKKAVNHFVRHALKELWYENRLRQI